VENEEQQFLKWVNEGLKAAGSTATARPGVYERWKEAHDFRDLPDEPLSDQAGAESCVAELLAAPSGIRSYVLHGRGSGGSPVAVDLDPPDGFERYALQVNERFVADRREVLSWFRLTESLPHAEVFDFLKTMQERETAEGDFDLLTIAGVEGLARLIVWRGYSMEEAARVYFARERDPEGFAEFDRTARTAKATHLLWALKERADYIAAATGTSTAEAVNYLLTERPLSVPFIRAEATLSEEADPVLTLTIGSSRVTPEQVAFAYRNALKSIEADAPPPEFLNDLEARRWAYYQEQSAQGTTNLAEQYRNAPKDVRGRMKDEASYRSMIKELRDKVEGGAV
jgi:hypothetical protein